MMHAPRVSPAARTGLWTAVLTLASLGTFAPKAEAQTFIAPGGCYRFNSSDTPDRTEKITPRSEVWCYRPVDSPQGAMFIFNADRSETRPELSALVEANGRITHGSLLGGEVTVHRLQSNYNPLPVPLAPPLNVDTVAASEVASSESSALQTLKFLLTQPVTDADIALRPGLTEAQVQASIKPWRGYWWPYSSGRLHSGAGSPLAKYDRFVQSRTGTNPGAQAWEKTNHRYEGVNWEGHCNGWAAASVLRPEPRGPRTVDGITFSVSDQKGLLSEKDYCVKYLFFGSRYRGQAGNDIKDIYASAFHNTLTYYIGNLKKPVAMDYMRERAVDNNIVSGYSMSIVGDGPGRYIVTTKLQMHKYDKDRVNKPGTAPVYTPTYKYRLWVDADGLITGSQWLSTNPDFIWVPLSPDRCGSSNPKVTEEWVKEITGF